MLLTAPITRLLNDICGADAWRIFTADQLYREKFLNARLRMIILQFRYLRVFSNSEV